MMSIFVQFAHLKAIYLIKFGKEGLERQEEALLAELRMLCLVKNL